MLHYDLIMIHVATERRRNNNICINVNVILSCSLQQDLREQVWAQEQVWQEGHLGWIFLHRWHWQHLSHGKQLGENATEEILAQVTPNAGLLDISSAVDLSPLAIVCALFPPVHCENGNDQNILILIWANIILYNWRLAYWKRSSSGWWLKL